MVGRKPHRRAAPRALFYAFSVLITDDGAGSVFSTSVLSLAFGGSALSGVAAAPVVVRLADRRGVRRLTLAGAVLGGLAPSRREAWTAAGPGVRKG